jgi:hypothetical protein
MSAWFTCVRLDLVDRPESRTIYGVWSARMPNLLWRGARPALAVRPSTHLEYDKALSPDRYRTLTAWKRDPCSVARSPVGLWGGNAVTRHPADTLTERRLGTPQPLRRLFRRWVRAAGTLPGRRRSCLAGHLSPAPPPSSLRLRCDDASPADDATKAARGASKAQRSRAVDEHPPEQPSDDGA